jgi:hypothetical protein
VSSGFRLSGSVSINPDFELVMTSSSRAFCACLFLFLLSAAITPSTGQVNSSSSEELPKVSGSSSGSTIALRAISTTNLTSEAGGAFMVPAKCDADGNLYIRKAAMDRPMLGPVVKVDTDGKRTALFDLAAFSQLGLDRADAFSPASDGGLYRIAQKGLMNPHIYVLHFSSDGSASSSTMLDADLEVYTFAAFTEGNFLVSGVKRDASNKNDKGRKFTAVFSADGRELAQLIFQEAHPKKSVQVEAKSKTGMGRNEPGRSDPVAFELEAPSLDLADAEVGSNGNLYVMRGSSPALVYVISPNGKIVQTLKVSAPPPHARPGALHVSRNRLAISFWNTEGERQTIVVADAETGRKIASYDDATGLGATFACYAADDGVFTFLKLGEGNELEVIRAEAQ